MAEERFAGLLESAPDAMVLVDSGGNIKLVNRQTETLFGYTRDELLGKGVEILVATPSQQVTDQQPLRRGCCLVAEQFREFAIERARDLAQDKH